jgi:hypothetical protein
MEALNHLSNRYGLRSSMGIHPTIGGHSVDLLVDLKDHLMSQIPSLASFAMVVMEELHYLSAEEMFATGFPE